MNKKHFRMILCLIVFSTGSTSAVTSRVGAAQDLGIGFALGQPMGFTAKYWLSSSNAVDTSLGYHFNSNMDAQVNYLWHSFSSFDISQGRLPFYVGLGSRVLLGNDSQLGARMPVGACYLFSVNPIEVFAEIAPVVKLVPKPGLDVDGRIGIRFYVNYFK